MILFLSRYVELVMVDSTSIVLVIIMVSSVLCLENRLYLLQQQWAVIYRFLWEKNFLAYQTIGLPPLSVSPSRPNFLRTCSFKGRASRGLNIQCHSPSFFSQLMESNNRLRHQLALLRHLAWLYPQIHATRK